ncbi:MAG: hypothetical protein WD556_00255, partial [Actinomycetota bacterium]
GNFRWVGPAFNGAGGYADPNGLGAMTEFPEVNGTINVAIPDGSGGVIIGGNFSMVGGQARANVAQVASNNSVTSFAPNPDGPVYALQRDAGTGNVFIGGDFDTVAGQPRIGLARVNSTGGSLNWNGVTNAGGVVRALALSGTTLFVGGEFTTLQGQARARLGSVAINSGNAAAFNPGPTGTVYDLELSGDGTQVYVGGAFQQIGGQNRGRLASFLISTGALQSLNGNADNTIYDLERSPNGNTLYAGGAFKNIAGGAVRSIVGLNPTTGAITALNNAKTSGTVFTIEAAADKLWYGGTFNHKSKQALRLIAQVNLTTGNTTDWQPPIFNGFSTNPKAGVNTMLTVGTKLFMGGTFRAYGGENREYLVAVNATTGALEAGFNPTLDGPVNALAASSDGTSIFAGGKFTQAGGQTRTRVAKFSATTGALVNAFADPVINKLEVYALAVTGNKLFVGGGFTKVAGVVHRRLAQLDATTAAVDPGFNLNVNGGVRDIDLTSNGQSMFISGNFADVDGNVRTDTAKIDTTDNTVAGWAPTFFASGSGALGRKLDVSPDNSAVYVTSAGPTGTPASNIAKFPTAGNGNIAPSWTNDVQDAIETVAVGSDAVYIGGHFEDVADGANPRVDRFQLAALNPSTGAPLAWDPGAGGYRGIFDMSVGAAGLIVGGDSLRIATKGHRGYAVFPGA